MGRGTLWSALLLVGGAPGALSYQAVQTPWPGTIKGTIRVKGAVPVAPAALANEVDTQACGAERPVSWIESSPSEARLSRAFVFIDNATQGRPLPRRAITLDVRDCMFPDLLAASVGDELHLGSIDSVAHQVGVTFRPDTGPAETWGNIALPPQGLRVRFKLAQPGWVIVKGRGAHPWMESRIRVMEHPYAALTNGEGTFEFRDLPAGTYTVRVWHPLLGSAKKSVELKAGYTMRADMELEVAAFNPKGTPPPSFAATPPGP